MVKDSPFKNVAFARASISTTIPGTKVFCATIVARLLDSTTFEIDAVGMFTDVCEEDVMTVSEVLEIAVMRSPNCVKGGLTPAGSVDSCTRTPMKPGKSGVTHCKVQSV